MKLSYLNRNKDAPLIRFLPDAGGGASAGNGLRISAIRTISCEEFGSIREGAERFGLSVENMLLAGFASLLSRLTRQGTFVIALDAANQAAFRLRDDCTFLEVLGQTRNTTAIAESEEQAPGHRVQYRFLTGTHPPARLADFGLQLVVKEAASVLELGSSVGGWEEGTLRAWLDYLLVLTQAASKDAEIPVSHLPLWDEAQARKFYASLNKTTVEFSGESSIPGRFAAKARQRPEATAVISSGRRYTYLELENRSTQLAQHIVAAGAGPGRAVAVCMERSVDLPLALMAVLKSGAYYVPLDPHGPGQRLRGILEECNPAVILSDIANAAALSAKIDLDAISILRIDQQTFPMAESSIHPGHSVNIDPDGLAYAIYTSGTTGKPKGVRITHRALLNLVCAMGEKPGFRISDRTLAVAPISFDIATMDMFLPICSGGTLVIASRQDALDPYHLAQLLKEHDITCMQATPTTWRLLLSSGWVGKKNLKVISGGEALPRELANDLLRNCGELWNCYGPTETAIYSGVIRIEPDSAIVPLGPPIANTTFYVLDNAGRLLPPGVPGELYIGGLGVSPGYISRPELTASRFVPDRFAAKSNGCNGLLFATGDLVRIVSGSRLEFFGRLDHQIKLRGFRVELGEIESVLRTHPAITDAVVVLREDLPGEPRLVAYVTCSGTHVGAAEAREHASTYLPEYMLPSIVVIMDQLPLLPSGKIDRRAFPVPESVPRQIAIDSAEAVPAIGELEVKLLKIFREELKTDSIGVTDSFFHFGGYSLLAVRLFSRIHKELGAQLPISLLFDAPTVRDLARVIRKGITPSVVVPIRPHGSSAPIFLVQSYLLYNAILEIVEYDRPVYGLREMGDEREPMSMENRASLFAHEVIRACPEGPLFLAGWCAAGTLTVEIARQLREAGRQVGLVALFDAECPGFTLPRGLKHWASRQVKKIAFHAGRLERIPWQQKVAYIAGVFLRKWDHIVESLYLANQRIMIWFEKRIGISLSKAVLVSVDANISQSNSTVVQPYPGKLNLFRASDIPDFSELDTTLGWASIAGGGVQVNFVPGDHVSMFKKPHNLSLARRLQLELQESEAAAFQN